MRKAIVFLLSAGFMLASVLSASAATLQVAPVLVEVPAPGAASTIILRNLDNDVINAQVRIFKWTQVNGKDELVPTRDVVASPPFARLQPNGNHTVRIVRVSGAPIAREESYRLIIDQIPSAKRKQGATINLVMRYSIPVFFGARRGNLPRLSWGVEQRGKKVFVTATNTGNRRVRIAGLKVLSPSGKTVSFGDGLVGYVLGGSQVRWSARGQLRSVRRGSEVKITANGDIGPIKARAMVQAVK